MREYKDIKSILLVPYVHADHAWTNSRQWHIKRYVEGMHRVLDYMKVNLDYTFLIDNPLHYYQVLEQFMPERMEELRERVKEGRICIANGGMSLARPYNYGDELYLRNAVAGRQFFNKLFPEADQFMFFNADAGVGHTQLPQMLRKMGHTHYRFSRPVFALDQTDVPREFIWRGLDGSEITASRSLYTGFAVTEYFDDAKNPTWEQKRDAFVKEELAYRLPLMESDHVLLFMGGDDTYPLCNVTDEAYDGEAFISQWNERESAVMRYATPAEYHRALSEETLPVWEGVCDPADLSYNGPGSRSDTSLSRRRFEAESLLLYAERLEVLLLELGGQPKEGLVKELWEQLFTFSGHAMQFLLTDDYEDLLERSDIVLGKAKQYIRQLLLSIAHEAGSIEPDSYILVNPCLFEREEVVTLLVTTPTHVFGLELYDEEGNALPYQIVDVYDGDKPYVNKDFNEVEVALTIKLPALGYRRIHAVRGAESMKRKAQREVYATSAFMDASQPIVLDNGRFRFTVAEGVVKQIEDSQTGDVKVGSSDSFGQLRFYTTTPEVEWTYTWERDQMQVFQPEKIRWDLRGPERWRILLIGKLNGLPAEVTISTTRNCPTLTYDILLETREDEGYFTVAFPCSGSEGIVAGIPFGAEPRDLRDVFYSEDHGIPMSDYLYFERGCKGSYCANRYTHFRMHGSKLLLTQGDASYHYRYNQADGEVETILLRSMDHLSREKLWMRHMHGTADRVDVHRFSFTASVLEPDVCQAQVERRVSQIRFPVRYTPVFETRPNLPAKLNSVIGSLPKNLTATAFYAEKDHYVLRLFENSGKGYTGSLQLIAGLARAESCDLMEQDTVPLTVCDDAAQITIKPWEIVTLRLWK